MVERRKDGLAALTRGHDLVEAPVDGLRGLVMAAGRVFGNAAGPITGKLVSEIVTGRPTSLDLAAFRVERHADSAKDSMRLW